MESTIAVIPKNRTQDLRIRLVEFHDKPFIDIRTFVVVDATERVPTQKGIAVPPRLLPELIAGLQKAEAEARAAGLIADKQEVA